MCAKIDPTKIVRENVGIDANKDARMNAWKDAR